MNREILTAGVDVQEHAIVTSCAVPTATLPAWLALGWRVVHEDHPMGIRGDGPHTLIEYAGDGVPPLPEGAAWAT